MKVLTKRAIATLGGVSAIVLTVGFGGAGVSPTITTPTAPTHSSSVATPARPDAAHPGVQAETLAGCVSGLNC